MLLEKPTLEIGNIYGFKLTNGDEIIGKLLSKGRGEIILQSPHAFETTPDGVRLTLWPTSVIESKSEIAVQVTGVISIYPPQVQYINMYKQLITK